eukprot:TRINITY_DN15822_c0_g1_i1.p1 TRINITY_DN15822_c0_g1~~TRINITY_DN15822_c0_g1_i1.p1  ORF type:complete len:544 (+),score=72.33 TRINITY_DN15822_c0_g1_i1:40-1671(+)
MGTEAEAPPAEVTQTEKHLDPAQAMGASAPPAPVQSYPPAQPPAQGYPPADVPVANPYPPPDVTANAYPPAANPTTNPPADQHYAPPAPVPAQAPAPAQPYPPANAYPAPAQPTAQPYPAAAPATGYPPQAQPGVYPPAVPVVPVPAPVTPPVQQAVTIQMPPEPVLPPHPRVTATCENKMMADGKTREYLLRFQIDGNEVHAMQWTRFSLLRQSFMPVNPNFPTRGFPFQNFVTNEGNVAKRTADLANYFTGFLSQRGVVSGPQFIGCPKLHGTMQMQAGSPGAVEFSKVGQIRVQIAQILRAAEEARLAAIRAQQQADCSLAQTFHKTVLPIGQISSIRFDREQQFKLKNKFWGCGDLTITGPGDLGWFKMVRTNPGSLFKSAHFIIANMAGEPLMIMEEQFAWANYKYDLYRLDSAGSRIHMARITRHWNAIGFCSNAAYSVDLRGPMTVCPPIRCHGRWPANFTLTEAVTGNQVATIDKKRFSFADTYELKIAANQDCLLFIGVACAIDRIHHEVEEEERRRRAAEQRARDAHHHRHGR